MARLVYVSRSVSVNSPSREATTWHQLGTLSLNEGDYATARAQFEASLAIKQEIRNRAGEAATWHQLGILAHVQGNYATARAQFEASLGIKQAIGNPAGEAATWQQLGMLAWSMGRPEQGVRLVGLCFLITQSIGHGDAESDLRAFLGKCEQLGYDEDRARQTLAEVAESYRADGGKGLLAAAFDGATTLMPGMAIAQFSTLCECCAPKREPAPLAVRITSGSAIWPLVM